MIRKQQKAPLRKAMVAALAVLLPFGYAHADNYASGGSNGVSVDSTGTADTGGTFNSVAGSDGSGFDEAFRYVAFYTP